MLLYRSFVIALVLLGLAAPAQAASDELPPEIRATLDAAAQSALPVGGLEAKAREGIAKGVPVARINAVLQQQAAQLARAQSLLSLPAGAVDRNDALTGAAFALDGGASDVAIRRLSRLDPSVRAPAMYSLGDLLRAGFSEASGLALVETAAASSQPVAAFSGLASSASELRGLGLSEPDVIASLQGQINAGRSPVGAVQDAAHGNGRLNNNGNHNGNGNGNGNRNGNGNGNGN